MATYADAKAAILAWMYTGGRGRITPESEAAVNVAALDAIRVDQVSYQAPVISRTASVPGSPANGDRYIVPVGATGDWASQDNKVAVYNLAGWEFTTPVQGWRIWVTAELVRYEFDGSAWTGATTIKQHLIGSSAITPTALSGNVDDYAPTSFATALVLRLDGGASSRNITGLAGGAAGLIKVIINVGASNNLVLKNNTTSTAANRFLFGVDIVLAPTQAALLWYDSASARWLCVGVFLGSSVGTVTNLATGTGLSGGPITSTGTLNLDFNALTEDTTPDETADFVPTYDTSAAGHRKAKPTNFKRSGGLQLLASGSVSAAATLDIVLTSYTGYRGIVVFLSLIPVSDGTILMMRFSTDGGSSFDATGYNFASQGITDGNLSVTTASGSDTKIPLTTQTGGALVGNAANEGVSTRVELLAQTNAALWSRVNFQSYHISNAATPTGVTQVGGGAREAAQDTDAMRFMFDTGNIASGTYMVYGLT